MRKILSLVCMGVLASAGSALADDNIAACELVIQQEVKASESGKKEAVVANFVPADEFMFSIFDAEDGHMTEYKGNKIRAVMCRRANLVPTEFDLKLIKTNIPLFLSTNFDAPNSGLMQILHTKKGYRFDYSGPDLSAEDKILMKKQLKVLNGG